MRRKAVVSNTLLAKGPVRAIRYSRMFHAPRGRAFHEMP